MEQLRQIFENIRRQTPQLSVTQKLLMASLCVLLVMTLFLVSQYAGSPTLVELIPGGAADDQQKAVAFLSDRGITHTVSTGGKVMVTPDRKYVALAAMAKEQKLPGDKKAMFDDLIQEQNIWMSKQQLDQQYTIKLQNVLALVASNFEGIEEASVVISAPEPKGLGSSFRKPVAQIVVKPASGRPLDPGTVNALAEMVSGSVAGLDVRDVAVIDQRNRRAFRASSPEDFAYGGTYLEQAAKVEQRIQEKLADNLRFIPDVIVSVNAIVDAARRERKEHSFMNKGEGSVSIPIEETTKTANTSNTSRSAEPGLGSNIGMSANSGSGGSGNTTSDESSTNKHEVRIGEKHVVQRDASGRPTKINVTVSVPRDYVSEVLKQRKAAAASGASGGGASGGAGSTAAAEPTEEEIRAEWDSPTGVKAGLEQMIAPLIETDGFAGAQLAAGTVKAFLIPVAMASVGGGHGYGGGSGGASSGGGASSASGGMFGGVMQSGFVKPVMLGVLAVAALGMMLMMVRKAGKAAVLPSAEELVGIPPALQPSSDIVGEALEGDTPMVGIEIDENALKTSKMLEEVATLVKSNPQQASQVFTRWVSTED